MFCGPCALTCHSFRLKKKNWSEESRQFLAGLAATKARSEPKGFHEKFLEPSPKSCLYRQVFVFLTLLET